MKPNLHGNQLKKLTWLGFEIGLESGWLIVPNGKLACLCELLQSLLEGTFVQAKVLAGAVGRIISMSPALGSVTRLMTRLYTILNSRDSWCMLLQLSDEAKQELKFWLAHIRKLNGQNLWAKSSVVRVVYSDASDTDYGGILLCMGVKLPVVSGIRKSLSRALHGRSLRQLEWF